MSDEKKRAQAAPTAEKRPLEHWAKLKNTSDFDLTGLRYEFHQAVNAEATEAEYDAALAKFRGTPVGYAVLGMKR